ncbi:tetratricopeptide repeat protein, partial [Spirulina sp. CS-785/01]
MGLCFKVLGSLSAVVLVSGMPVLFPAESGVGVVQAQTTEEQKAEADRLYEQGLQQYNAENYYAALQSFQQASNIYEAISDGQGTIATGIYFGYTLIELGETERAINIFQTLLEVAQENNLSELEEIAEQGLQAARNQNNSTQTSEQNPQLAEAERLNQQVEQLYQAGKYEEAIPLAERALEIRQQVLGEEHPSVATSLNNLAGLYSSQGRYTEAEPLYQQALEMRKRLLGEEHPHVASSLNNLAFLYRSQGRYTEAEPLYQQALEMRQRLLGEEHPDVATSLNNLAELYSFQGRYTEAELLYQQALEMTKRLL